MFAVIPTFVPGSIIFIKSLQYRGSFQYFFNQLWVARDRQPLIHRGGSSSLSWLNLKKTGRKRLNRVSRITQEWFNLLEGLFVDKISNPKWLKLSHKTPGNCQRKKTPQIRHPKPLFAHKTPSTYLMHFSKLFSPHSPIKRFWQNQ